MSSYPIPSEALEQHTLVLGKTGAGKSSVLRGLVERHLSHEQPVCIVDPKGDWWGIKSSADGKSAGFPLVIFGGEHADVPINAHAGAQVAELYATGNRPCLIDLGGWMPGDRTRFFIDFASKLFRHTRGARWLVIDEVHNFAPQGKVMDPDAGKMLHWANRIITEGRGKGVTVLSASQRPQKVHKDFVTSNETLIAMRVIHELDRMAIKAWIDGCGDPEKGREVLGSLANMKRGEGWVWSPEIGFGPKRVDFPMFTTYDSFAPQASEADRHPKGWAEVDLDDVKSKLAAAIEQAEQDDPRALRARIAQLERDAGKPRELAVDTKALDDAFRRGFRRGHEDATSEGVRQMSAVQVEIDNRIRRMKEEAGEPSIVPPVENPKVGSPASPDRQSAPLRPSPAPAQRASSGRQIDAGGATLPKGERAILIACAQHPSGCTREQLSVLTGYKRSSRDTYLQRLREREFIVLVGESIQATHDGFKALGDDFEPLPTGAALRAHWLGKLPAGESKMLGLIAGKYPRAADREWLSKETGYQRSSRDTYIQRLAARRLVNIVGRGEVAASRDLFE